MWLTFFFFLTGELRFRSCSAPRVFKQTASTQVGFYREREKQKQISIKSIYALIINNHLTGLTPILGAQSY